jgi:NAD(P)-dependent dehydrogenase (short-subunit alcohol dehydrogenase family)
MDLGLSGKTAVVTGASKGIGLAIMQALVGEGARVIAGSRSSSAELDELVATGSVLSRASICRTRMRQRGSSRVHPSLAGSTSS